MIYLSDSNNFKPIKKANLVVQPPEEIIGHQVLKDVESFLKDVKKAEDLPVIFSKAIRNVEHESVSNDTFSYMLIYDENSSLFKEYKVSFDEQGNIIQQGVASGKCGFTTLRKFSY